MNRIFISLLMTISFLGVVFAEIIEFKEDGFSVNIPSNYTYMNNDGDLAIQTEIPGIAFEFEKSLMPWKEIQAGTAQAYIKEANLIMFKTTVVSETIVTNSGIVFRCAEIIKNSPKNPDYAYEVFAAYFQTKKGIYRMIFECGAEFYPNAVIAVKSFITGIAKLK